ncbi:MAG: RraA family protein [Saprospiraceae bacterium]|nr:RraA family protein [Saprospiraceae bacterium]
MNFKDESQLLQAARDRLYSAVIGDVLDQIGYPKQFLPSYLRPVQAEMIIAGRIMTVLGKDLDQDSTAAEDPYGLLFDALDDLSQDEVFLYTGGQAAYAIWGGLMSTRASQLGAAGAVIDGCYRDTKEILQLQFPTFARAAYAPDQKGRGIITDYRCLIKIGEVTIQDRDFIFGDRDGVVVIPASIASQVFTAAFTKVSTENQLRLALEQGMSAKAAYEKFGIF